LYVLRVGNIGRNMGFNNKLFRVRDLNVLLGLVDFICRFFGGWDYVGGYN